MKMTGLRLIGLTTINLPLVGAQPSDQFILKAVDGLGPVEMNVSIARGVFRRRELNDREIVARIGLNPNWSAGQSPGSLRDQLYGLLSPGLNSSLVRVEIMNGDTVVASTSGVVRTLETVSFSKDPEVQVTIPCLNPNLEGPAELTLENLTGSAPAINNIGTLPAPFRVTLKLGAFGSGFSIYSGDAVKNRIEFDFTPQGGVISFTEGWTAVIDTREGKRYAWISSDANPTGFNMLPYMTKKSVWPVLMPGVQPLVVSDPVMAWTSVIYTPKFWGI